MDSRISAKCPHCRPISYFCHNLFFIRTYTLFGAMLYALISPAQRVGVVLSGGGSSGLCHIGVLKALEENNIPVDYICGTSFGGLVGAYYASGYSPSEIENLVKTYFFQSITRGDLPVKYEYMIKKRQDYASWLTFKYNFRDNYIKNLPTNIINSIPIDYYLMETFTGPSNKSSNNFDSLMIPFRCVAADVERKESVVFRAGDLPSAIRASMSYPFYLRPIMINNQLLFDGGLYNNFPTDVMESEFTPDIIIGSDVAEKSVKPDDDNLYLQLRTLLTTQVDNKTLNAKSVIVQPWSGTGLFNFENAQRLVDSGYAATMRQMPAIKARVSRKADSIAMTRKRAKFSEYRQPDEFLFTEIDVIGFTEAQKSFITKSLFYDRKPFTLRQLKKRYFRLASDDKVKNIFPVAVYNPMTKTYKLELIGKREKPFYLEPGAIISNRPISEGFLGMQYNALSRIGFSAYANGYIGKLYTGAMAKIRLDFPGRMSPFIEPSATVSFWDYYSSSALFYDFLKPAYLVQEDRFAELKAGVPVGNFSQFSIAGGFTEWKNQYYQADIFTRLDTADVTYFDYWYTQANYLINTHNRKMYATDGTLLSLRARYLRGQESYFPGSTSIDTTEFRDRRGEPWLQLKMTFDGYIKTFRRFKIGLFAEGVLSTQGFFHNYQSTILSAPAFNPTPESQTFFLQAYRAHKYIAAGVKAITSPSRFLDVRLETYVFQPVNAIIRNSDGTASYSTPFLYRRFSGLAALVYNSPVGPISAGVNFYDEDEQRTVKNSFSFFFHLGYIIFNRKSID
jgi:NTE family protein